MRYIALRVVPSFLNAALYAALGALYALITVTLFGRSSRPCVCYQRTWWSSLNISATPEAWVLNFSEAEEFES